MPAEYTPADIPLYDDQATRDEQYRAAERDEAPYLAVEAYDDGYAVTYDLLPAGVELSEPMGRELTERVRRAVEDIVGDEARATAEVSTSVSTSLGSIGVFERERAAREVAVVVANLALDEDNWVDGTPVGGPDEDSLRRN